MNDQHHDDYEALRSDEEERVETEYEKAPEEERPVIPPAPRKYHEKRWGEMTAEEQKEIRATFPERAKMWRNTIFCPKQKVFTIEYLRWDRERTKILHEFYSTDAVVERERLKKLAAMTPEERQFEEDQKAWRRAESEWLDNLSPEDFMLAMKGKLTFPGWELYAVSDYDPKAAKEARSEALRSRMERYARARKEKTTSLLDAALVVAEGPLGRVPETPEEFEAVEAYANHIEATLWFVKNKQDHRENPAWVTHQLAAGKLTEKLRNLAKGRTTKVRKQEYDAKRKDDPERKAKKAQYERERRARLKAEKAGKETT